MVCLVNGVEADEGTALLNDRGLHYGDGLFRTLAVCAGEALDLAGQLEHLRQDAQRLRISAPWVQLQAEAVQLARQQEQGVLKILITRGSGPRGYQAPPELNSNRYLFFSTAPANIGAGQQQGIRSRICRTRLSSNPALAGIKHLNRLEQVLARQEWDSQEIAEGLMLDSSDQLISGVQSNLFLVVDGRLLTPLLDASGVRGRMRARVMALARQLRLPCDEQALSLADLQQADEVFLTNSLIGVWPVIHCEQWQWPTGKLTRRLQSLLDHPALS